MALDTEELRLQEVAGDQRCGNADGKTEQRLRLAAELRTGVRA